MGKKLRKRRIGNRMKQKGRKTKRKKKKEIEEKQ